jgi:hypothetical protein
MIQAVASTVLRAWMPATLAATLLAGAAAWGHRAWRASKAQQHARAQARALQIWEDEGGAVPEVLTAAVMADEAAPQGTDAGAANASTAPVPFPTSSKAPRRVRAVRASS